MSCRPSCPYLYRQGCLKRTLSYTRSMDLTRNLKKKGVHF
nr:MAG TPA: hypothetical protein [Bacteriophage sp.]